MGHGRKKPSQVVGMALSYKLNRWLLTRAHCFPAKCCDSLCISSEMRKRVQSAYLQHICIPPCPPWASHCPPAPTSGTFSWCIHSSHGTDAVQQQEHWSFPSDLDPFSVLEFPERALSMLHSESCYDQKGNTPCAWSQELVNLTKSSNRVTKTQQKYR